MRGVLFWGHNWFSVVPFVRYRAQYWAPYVCQFSEAHSCVAVHLHVPHWIPATSCAMDLAVRLRPKKVAEVVTPKKNIFLKIICHMKSYDTCIKYYIYI